MNITGAGLKDYDEALKAVSKRKTSVLSRESLKSSKELSIREPLEDFVRTSALPLMGITSDQTVKETKAENISKNKSFYRKQKREAEDIVWRANGYIF